METKAPSENYSKASPYEVLIKFGNHKLSTGKCLIERDALKLCMALHDKKQCEAFKHGLLICLKNNGLAIID
ncbi:hypothetical protein FGO68_gene2624 [Halteria grandinella]|uniref:Uncharacterized protein n=1 Tax=Halteria grandinella TaxID=5974 RepID=A0A8J8T8C2_HALGN|nr:hypothetical protein FGO68_gene2624 [Halteria grandinella]